MANYCEICGKTSVAGQRTQHHHSIGWRFRAQRSKRTFKPNVREVTLETDGKIVKAIVCMKCYKKLRKQEEALTGKK